MKKLRALWGGLPPSLRHGLSHTIGILLLFSLNFFPLYKTPAYINTFDHQGYSPVERWMNSPWDYAVPALLPLALAGLLLLLRRPKSPALADALLTLSALPGWAVTLLGCYRQAHVIYWPIYFGIGVFFAGLALRALGRNLPPRPGRGLALAGAFVLAGPVVSVHFNVPGLVWQCLGCVAAGCLAGVLRDCRQKQRSDSKD
jgi:peptidoglycan/LPS O-acetylase OafA/YrhL